MLPAGQALPQAPQLPRSVARSAQNAGPPPSPPPQVASVAPQETPHWPSAQTWPVGQVVPQLPQLALSVAAATQRLLQTISVGPQVGGRSVGTSTPTSTTPRSVPASTLPPTTELLLSQPLSQATPASIAVSSWLLLNPVISNLPLRATVLSPPSK